MTLLDLVDALTLPQHTRERQEILKDGEVVGNQTVTITHEALLVRLDNAIRSSMGGTTSGASLAHTRSLADDDALYKFILIEKQIKEWCQRYGAKHGNGPAEDLRSWYAKTLETGIDEHHETYYVKTIGGWVGLINSKLDPWREMDLPDACPLCLAKAWWQDGEMYLRPLIIKYRPESSDLVGEARALCRACETVWPARALAYDLENPDQVHLTG